MPLIYELVSKQEDRQLLDLMIGPSAMARPFAGPPGLPPKIATMLRRAFDATMKDPAFIAEGEKIQAEVLPTTGEDVQKLVAKLYAHAQAGGRSREEVSRPLVPIFEVREMSAAHADTNFENKGALALDNSWCRFSI